jgi:hypothetical protein
MSIALTTTAQACTRILVNEVWGNAREITLWDQDQVSDLRLPFKETMGNDDIWQGSGYTVTINKQSTGGAVTYPNGYCEFVIFPSRTEFCGTTVISPPTQKRAHLFDVLMLTRSFPVAGGLSQQARKQTTTSDGRTQVYYCLWDSYDCGNYACGFP